MDDWKDGAEMRQDGEDIHQFIDRECFVVHNSTPAVARIGHEGMPGATSRLT